MSKTPSLYRSGKYVHDYTAQSTTQKPSDIPALPNSRVSGPSPEASPDRAGVEALKGTILPNGTRSCPGVPSQTQQTQP